MKLRSALNRILLVVAGLVLLGGGLLILTAGLDLYRHWRLTPPTGWPLTTPNDVLLGSADRARWSSQGWWWWPAVIAVLALIALLALGWLIAQSRRRHPGGMPLGGTPPQEGVELRDRALSDAIAAEAGELPGVQQATTRITGSPTHPHARVTLTLTSHGAPRPVLHELCQGPLEHACRSTGWKHLPAEARLRVAGHKPHRVE